MSNLDLKEIHYLSFVRKYLVNIMYISFTLLLPYLQVFYLTLLGAKTFLREPYHKKLIVHPSQCPLSTFIHSSLLIHISAQYLRMMKSWLLTSSKLVSRSSYIFLLTQFKKSSRKWPQKACSWMNSHNPNATLECQLHLKKLYPDLQISRQYVYTKFLQLITSTS